MDAVCCNNDMMCESVVLVIVNLPPVYEEKSEGIKKGKKSVFAMRYKYNLYAGSVCEYWAKVRMTISLRRISRNVQHVSNNGSVSSVD